MSRPEDLSPDGARIGGPAPQSNDRPSDGPPGRPALSERTWGDSVADVQVAIREWAAIPWDDRDDGHMATLEELYRMRAAALVRDVAMRRGGGQ